MAARRIAVRQEKHPPPRHRQPERHGPAENAAVQVGPQDEERDERCEAPFSTAAALVVDDAHHGPAEERDREHVRPDVVVERANKETPADHERRERPAHAGLQTAPEDQREEQGGAGREREQHGIEPAGPVRQRHKDFSAPLLRHPALAREGVAERIGPRHPLLENDLAHLDVPERAGIVEPPLAKCDEED